MAENKHVRLRLPSGILAVALSYALAPGLVGLAYQSPGAQEGSHTVPAPEDRVDINAASLDRLMKVPGMTRPGPSASFATGPIEAKTTSSNAALSQVRSTTASRITLSRIV
jgi:hypothetical protein